MLKQIFNNNKSNERDSLEKRVGKLEKEFATVKTDFIEINDDFDNLENENVEFEEETNKTIKILRREVVKLKQENAQLKELFYKTSQRIENQIAELPVMVMGETAIAENVLKHHLRTSPQTKSKNYRYYYNSNYLFTAPLNLKNILTIEFNRLMNSNLSFENVVEELKVYKQSLETELKANGIQTELGALL